MPEGVLALFWGVPFETRFGTLPLTDAGSCLKVFWLCSGECCLDSGFDLTHDDVTEAGPYLKVLRLCSSWSHLKRGFVLTSSDVTDAGPYLKLIWLCSGEFRLKHGI